VFFSLVLRLETKIETKMVFVSREEKGIKGRRETTRKEREGGYGL
jgi:hypothetical protein